MVDKVIPYLTWRYHYELIVAYINLKLNLGINDTCLVDFANNIRQCLKTCGVKLTNVIAKKQKTVNYRKYMKISFLICIDHRYYKTKQI